MGSVLEYSRWEEEYRSILESFSGKHLLMLFSGGKDSSLAMDFLLRAREIFGFDFEAHAGAYPIHRYPERERNGIELYWSKRGVEIQWHDLGETDEYLEHEKNPCLQCQRLRKRILNTILTSLVDDWKSLVLVAGYSLWDIVSYSIEHILGDLFSNSVTGEDSKRFMETAQRFYPVLKMKEGYTIFRPLVKYNSDDIRRTIQAAGIPTLSVACKFDEFRPKRIFEGHYQKTGIRFDYDRVLNFARKSLNLPDLSVYTTIEKEKYLQDLF